jgi:hypothetical protein
MRNRFLLGLLLAVALLAGSALAGAAAGAPGAAAPPAAPAAAAAPAAPAAGATSPAFDHIKALSGNWLARSADGKVTRVSYDVYAGGSAVVEKLAPEGEPPMVTVYYPDGSQVMLTHYCTLANQPRMRTTQAGSGNTLDFAFVDATNMKSPNDPHMDRVKLTFGDADHFSQEWTMKKDGQEMPLTMRFERTK